VCFTKRERERERCLGLKGEGVCELVRRRLEKSPIELAEIAREGGFLDWLCLYRRKRKGEGFCFNELSQRLLLSTDCLYSKRLEFL
jgi:hypothetical protein